MITRFKFLLIALLGIFCFSTSFAAPSTPVGFWETLDADDGKPRSIIQISNNNGNLSGIVIKQFPRAGESANPVCSKCKDEFKNKPIIGSTILLDVKKTDDAWEDGSILVPKRGEVLHCDISLIDDNTLKVRVYKNAFMGKTQVWKRVADPKASS